MSKPLAFVAAVGMALAVSAAAFAQQPPKYSAKVPDSIQTPDLVETSRLGRLEFFDGMPSDETVRKVYDQLDFSRGVEAMLTGCPAASIYAFVEGMKETGMDTFSMGIHEQLLDARSLWLTPNTTVVYCVAEINVKNGPTVMEVPPGVLGPVNDAFFRWVVDVGFTGPDRGQGGKYLFLPPGYEGEIPESYFVARTKTYRNWLLMRAFVIEGDLAKTAAHIKKHWRLYPLAEAANPRKPHFVDLSGKQYNTIHANDFSFFEELNSVVQYEPADAFNPELVGLWASIGIKKGQPFAPDERMKKILTEAAAVGNATARALSYRPRSREPYFYEDRQWYTAFVGGSHEFMNNGELMLDYRTFMHYMATGITPAMAQSAVGQGSAYAFTPHDAEQRYLDGGKTYRVTLPAPVPAKDFWSFVVYSGQHRSLLETDQRSAGIDSKNPDLKANADGSYTVYFGPKPPPGKEGNWVQTVPGKSWSTLLRLYGPLEPWFDKTWKPGDIELVELTSDGQAQEKAPGFVVTQETYCRAETDRTFYNAAKLAGGVNRFFHFRAVTPLDNQTVVRMNRDTLYSPAVVDTSKGATITVPTMPDGRYCSVLLIDNDHYCPGVIYEAGTHQLPQDTKYLGVLVRIQLLKPTDPEDVALVNRLQDQLVIKAESADPFPQPKWDATSLDELTAAYKAEFAKYDKYPDGFMGARGVADEKIRHIACAGAWGLFPNKHAVYINYNAGLPAKGHHTATYKVPENNAFWSITVYGADGYMKSDNAILNGSNTKMNPDGTFTVHFGSKEDCGDVPNRLDVSEGWNFLMRVYRPGRSVLDGSYKLPEVTLATTTAKALTPAEVRAIAKEAYIYGFPLVDNMRIQYSYFTDKKDPDYKAPYNTLFNIPRVFTPDDKAIQTANSDTPYSWIGLDLRAEPIVFTVPPIAKERYWSLQLIDLYTHNFDYLGSRTTGNDGGSYLIAGPKWSGEKPQGITKVIRCETEIASAQFRTQLFNPGDLDSVKKIQEQYIVKPLSAFLGQPAPQAAPAIDFPKPLTPVTQKTSLEFFTLLNFYLQYCPPHPSEKALMERFAKVGVGAGQTFDASKLSPETRKAIEGGIADAWAEFQDLVVRINKGEVSSGDAFGTREYLQNNYLYRMGAAVIGIYGNDKEEAIYPVYFVDGDKQKLDGRNRYTLRFAKGQLPPVNSFWSLTMYDQPASLLVHNPINRYLLNSTMLPEFTFDDDGGLTLYIQNDSPGKDKEANWLPAPKGPFSMVLRLYWPKAEALNGKWKQPPLMRVK